MPPDQRAIGGVNDSKQLDAETRERLAIRIRERALAIALGAASVHEVDRLNIYHATVLAMRRALARLSDRLGRSPDHILIDGRTLRTLGHRHTSVVKGDAKCYAIACASIVAKVSRDRLMHALARRYEGYAWDRNVGYGTPYHLAALAARGLTPHHRRSFCLEAQVSFDDLLMTSPSTPSETPP
jgi:ribonuclease HII